MRQIFFPVSQMYRPIRCHADSSGASRHYNVRDELEAAVDWHLIS